MNRSDIIASIAKELMSNPYGNGVYDRIARNVGKFCMSHGRLANVDEIEEIASVGIMSDVEPSDVMYEADYDALPKTSKVNVDGVPHVIINGNAVKVSFIEDGRAFNISNMIIGSMRSAYNGMNKSGTTFDELFVVEDVECCPECGSYDCTMFYGDDDGDAWHCNACGSDFFVEKMVVIDTTEEIDLIPEHDIVMAFNYNSIMKCFDFTIFMGDEPIYSATAGSHDQMMAFGSGFINAWDMMHPGIGLANVESGRRFDIDAINGDSVLCGDKTASRAKMAASIACGSMMAVSDQIYANDVVAGDVWSSTTHDVEVDIVDDDSVYWYEHEAGKAISSNDYYTDSIQGFLAHMDSDGFSQV